MRIMPSLGLLALLLAGPAIAQEPAGTTEPAGTKERLTNDPAVRDSQLPNPTMQGNRPPEANNAETEKPSLTEALKAYYRAPPDLQGNPVPRPNEVASNPMEWQQTGNQEPQDLVTDKDIPQTRGAEPVK